VEKKLALTGGGAARQVAALRGGAAQEQGCDGDGEGRAEL
jgi:hypothetical protein